MMAPIPATILVPRASIPIACVISAFVLGWPALGLVESGVEGELWWAVAILAGISGTLAYAAAHGVVHRHQWVIAVSHEGVAAFGVQIPRDEVVRVARYVDLWFKGVRIELVGGGWINVPVHLHRPGKVLAAFEQHGYPVGGP